MKQDTPTQQNQSPALPPDTGIPGTPLPVAGILLILCCAAGGSWYIHRWYVRSQNPALFRDRD